MFEKHSFKKLSEIKNFFQQVIFVGKPPEHEHIYSNGFICLSILYDGEKIFLSQLLGINIYLLFIFKKEWSAALTVSSVCMSILSMLSSAKKKVALYLEIYQFFSFFFNLNFLNKSKPFNDAEFCKRAAGRSPKAFYWYK